MSEQTPRRRRADRAYTPEENEAAPCRRRMNADEPPRRRRTREYYSPEEFIPYPAADSFDTMPPDIPFDMPPDTPSAPPKRKFRLPPLGESLRRTMQLLRSARPDFPFRRPHGVGDLLNMLLDALLWVPKLIVHLTLYACRYLRASVRYAVEGATPLWQAFLLRPYSWAGFYLLLGGLAFSGVHLMSRGTTGASFAGCVLLLAPPLLWLADRVTRRDESPLHPPRFALIAEAAIALLLAIAATVALVRIGLGRGTASETAWTCDFSHEYVTINADYRS